MKEFIDKLIGRLKEHCGIKSEVCDCNGVCSECDFKASIEIAKELAEEYKGGWIPCSERLPENNKVVLCWVKSTTIASGETYIIGSCDRGFWFLQTYEIGHHHFPVKDYEVVAWQQLPEEYQSPKEPWKDAMMNTFLAGKV